MQHLKLLSAIILSACLLFACSCNNPGNTDKKNNAAQAPANDSTPTTNSSTATQDSSNQVSDTTVKSGDTTASTPNRATDSMLSQLKNITSMLGKNDSGILKNIGGGGSMDSMMKKMQSMMGGKNGNPGDGIANSLLDLQLGQMKDNNPLKFVAKGMMEAQKNGTAGPSKTYTATYTPEQAPNYTVPVSGNGNTIMLQYKGGSIANNKKDGLWKNIYISTNKANKWNVYSEGYAESSALNMKVHATSLSGLNESYNIILNDQYKKYNKQQKNDLGKNESNVQVQKIGNEKMFGYNCVHIKVTYTLKALGQTVQEQNDEWYSVDVPGSQFLSLVIFENHSPDVVKAITNTGCSGALVKSITKSSGSTQIIQLSSITRKDMPDSTFNLPAKYHEDKNTALYDLQ
jgi:polyhydroxyalkanoate synthesis regulator phasin